MTMNDISHRQSSFICHVSTVFLVLLALVIFLLFTITSKTYSNKFNDCNDYRVELSYQLNQGHSILNNSLVTFRNVRFAAPPVGPLRFVAPSPPLVNRSGIQDAADVICPQAYPTWVTTGAVTPFSPNDIPPIDPRTLEDCLFLDVLLPKRVWKTRRHSRAPVLVWFHGGAFDIGWKDLSGRGYGLVSRSHRLGSQGVILVSANYRLGLFGWMNGAGVTSNAGLLDQRLVLEWVQKYIHLFGGDSARVSVLGSSAGASSVEAHITAYGGTKGPSPFKGAIAQSPYYLPTGPRPSSMVDAVLRLGNVSSIEALRRKSSADLQTLNALLVGNSQPFGTATFGIVPDEDYVPNLPGKLLAQGRFDRTLFVMTGHNRDEGSRFVPNTLAIDEVSYADFIQSLMPQLTQNATDLQYITQVLYPPVFDGSQGYTNQTERNNLTVADMTFVCNARFLDQASFLPPTYAYEFSVPPALHGADLTYTFYDFGPMVGVNSTLAEIMQGYITSFVETGQPNAPSLPGFSPARPARTVQNLGVDFVGPMQEEERNGQLEKRCRYWQDVSYLAVDR